MNYTVGNGGYSGAPESTSAWGGQFVAAGDYGLTRSGRFRLGVTARYYYLRVGPYRTGRIFTVGPDFTFSFR
jgi:hypothetical protein